ncbi:hypothetical protein ACRQ4C_01480 [Curtobacterium sp. SP.BCp]|uniref:hypothetical protein n=1 Tax=Curtobacterium sp. SP.BCp TaxID=3435230 RepID=UPI003F73A581
MRDQHQLHQLRQNPTEWHRRGMTAPAEIDVLVANRLQENYPTIAAAGEPSYADFFTAPAAA